MPKGYHEKFAGRTIRTLKDRKRAMLASLSYKLPDNLDAEAYVAAARGLNCTPCSRSGLFTPYELVRGRKPFIPLHHFGQTGVFYQRRHGDPNTRSE